MQFENDTLPLLNGTLVISSNIPDMLMQGTIAGIAQPRSKGWGYLYILKLDEQSSQKLKGGAGQYAYDCIAVPETDLELVN